MKIIRIVLISIVIISCNNAKKEPVVNAPDTLNAETIRIEDSLKILSTNTDNWIINQLQQDRFNWQQLQLSEHYKNDSNEVLLFDPQPEFYKNYSSVLRWSPDSSYILDIGSYGSVLVKDDKGNMQVEAGEPDSEIALLQPSTNKKWSLFFVGPSSNIIDGKWVDNNNAVDI